jgi:hypothetical protein
MTQKKCTQTLISFRNSVTGMHGKLLMNTDFYDNEETFGEFYGKFSVAI